jgi:hypothetical protein
MNASCLERGEIYEMTTRITKNKSSLWSLFFRMTESEHGEHITQTTLECGELLPVVASYGRQSQSIITNKQASNEELLAFQSELSSLSDCIITPHTAHLEQPSSKIIPIANFPVCNPRERESIGLMITTSR